MRLDMGQSLDGTRDFPVTMLEKLDGTAGENLALEDGRVPDKVYLPKPERDQVTVVENDDMMEVRSFSAGEAPARVALGGSSLGYSTPTLFALSEDGSMVTLVELDNFEEITEVEVEASEDALIEASGGDEIGFWLAGPNGVTLYAGDPPESLGELPLEAGALAVDVTNPQRAYVGETASGRVVAVEPDEEGGLQTAEVAHLSSPAEYLATEEGRLYAITGAELVVLDSETLETVETVKLGPIVAQESLEEAEPSDLVVGEENVYVTLEGEPYVLLIEKP